MDDLDTVLDGLSRHPPHPALDGMEARILSRIATGRHAQGGPSRFVSLAMIGAMLGLGVVSGRLSDGPGPVTPLTLDAGLSLAPSSRLAAMP